MNLSFKTYIISLLHRADRRASLVASLHKQGIFNYSFLSGYPNNDIELKNEKQSWLKSGQIGFNVAYYMALATIALNHSKDEYVLLLEDDAVLCDNFKHKVSDILQCDFDMCYLFFAECKERGDIIKSFNGFDLISVNYPVCTTGIIYKVSAIKKVLEFLIPMNTVYDNQIGLRINEINACGCMPHLVHLNGSNSDIMLSS